MQPYEPDHGNSGAAPSASGNRYEESRLRLHFRAPSMSLPEEPIESIEREHQQHPLRAKRSLDMESDASGEASNSILLRDKLAMNLTDSGYSDATHLPLHHHQFIESKYGNSIMAGNIIKKFF